MLTRSSINATYPMAAMLASKGVSLQALDQTPLAQLISTSLCQHTVVASVHPDQLVDAATPSFASLLESGSQFADPMGRVAHDDVMAETIKIIGQAVEFDLNNAREVVNPIINAVHAATEARMREFTPASLVPVYITPVSLKPIWLSPILRELVERYSSVAMKDLRLEMLQIQPEGDLRDRLMTGAGRFDEEIAAFYDACGEDAANSVWNAVFGPNSTTSLNSVLRSSYDAFDDALLTFLFARRLGVTTPAGVNMDLSAWTAYVSEIEAQAGRQILLNLEKYDRDTRMKKLVLAYPTGQEPKGAIQVLGNVYGQFLKEGGSPEILFGGVYNDVVNYDELLANKELMLKTWQRNFALMQSNASYHRFNAMIDGLRSATADAINSLSEDHLVQDRSILHERLRERMTHVKQKDMEDLYHVARKTVCRVIFPHTNAEKILLAIDAAAVAHPQLDLREAALLATIDHVALWIANLIRVEQMPDLPGGV